MWNDYLSLKLIHLCAAILWSASALGAFWYLIVSTWERRQDPSPEQVRRDDWLRYHFGFVVMVEHLAFFVLVPTGLQLARVLSLPLFTPWMMPWLAAKLLIVWGLFIPMEVLDIWLSHWVLPRRYHRREVEHEAWVQARRWHDLFLVVGGALVVLGIPAVLYLIVMKPRF